MRRYEQIVGAGLTGISRRAMLGVITIGISLALSLTSSTALAQKGKPGGGGGGGGGNTANSAIVYTENDILKVMDANGANQVQVGSVQAYSPHWYPDGKRISFQSTVQGAGIYRINVDGTGLVKVAAINSRYFWGAEVSPVPGPNGYRIAFSDFKSGTGYSIYVVNEDGSGLVRVTAPPGLDDDDFYASWSPDGQFLVFVRNNYDLRLVALDEDSHGNTTPLGDMSISDGFPFGSTFGFPSFAKSEFKIFTSIYFPGELSDLWALDLSDLGNPVRLTSTYGVQELSPSGSPDGSKITYASGGAIYIADSDGSNPVNIGNPAKKKTQKTPSFRRYWP
jgi:Tol biopolymer transport system component